MPIAPAPRFSRPALRSSASDVTGVENIERITDIYYHEAVPNAPADAPEPGGAGAYGFSGKPKPVRFKGTPMQEWVDNVAAILASEFPYAEDFRVMIDGITWRCCRDVSGLSAEVSMRQITSTLPTLSDINTTNVGLIGLLEHPFLNDGGVVLISGLNGSGKTTLCGAFLHSRMKLYGGRCVSVEDPKELAMEGFIGEGVVRQMEVRYDEGLDAHRRGFAGAIRRAYRKFPASRPIILYVGEVRDEETAVEILKAGSNGMLVLTTIHAETATAAIERLIGLASIRLGPGVNAMAASAIRLSIHSTLEWIDASAGESRFKRARSILEALFSSGPTHALAALIRSGQFHQIGQVCEKQAALFHRASIAGTPPSVLFTELGGKT